MPMKDRLNKFRRDRWRDQVLATGKRLREMEYARGGIDATVWPDVAEGLDLDIDRLTRRRDRLLTKLKETA